MQKKIKSKQNDSLFKYFVITIFICLIGAFISSALFYKGFFRALTKLNEEPIATITFKYKTAQRKFLERVVWDRLRQNSPVYNGDTIHTENLAEATVYFIDGNVMNLSENTMAQVFLSEDKLLTAELTDGYATVDAGEAGAGVVLVADGMEIALEAGSSVGAGIESKSKSSGVVGESSLEKEEVQKETEEKRGLSVQVLKGNAVVQSEDGTKVDVVEGQGIAFDKQGQSLPVLVVTNPLPNSKVLSTTEEKVLVPFKWNFGETKISENQKVYLTVAIDKDFENVVALEDITNQNEKQIQLDAEKYFWKVSVVEDATKEKVLTSQSGKLQIIKSLKPNQIVPAENASFSYRSRIPSIRFMWGEANQATSYKVEIATNPSMENPIVEQRTNLTSLIISTLEFGNYYWRVTPYYTINNLGFANPSEVKSFSVERKSVLKKPSLYVPLDNGIVNTDEEIGSIAFSWQRESEAESYIVKIANNSELKNPFIIETTKDNFFTFDTKNVEKKLKDGKWFWSVTVQDFEGTLSEAADIRTFFAMKGKPEQHLIEPFDGFKVADSFVFDTKFTWKKNFPESFESYLQISKNQDFRKIEKEEKVLGNSFSGANLKEGVYYWRLKSVNTIDGSEFVTSGRKIDVVGNLAAANLIEPTEKIIARENVPCEFKWSEVSDASYYKLMIYKKSDNKLVLEDVIYDTEYKTDLFHNSIFEDKTMYRWELQAHANAIPGISSRRTGKIVEGEFLFARLRPVSIDFPPKNYVLKGEDAILKPITAKWSSVDKVKSAQFVLRKVDEGRPIEVIKIPTDEQMKGEFKIAPNKVLLDTPDGIKTGRYEIVVYAQTLDDIDISNIEEKYLGKFTVLPIEPLEQSKNLQVSPQSFDIEYLKNQKNPKTITFKWGKVSKATEYHFEIIDQKGKSVLSEIIKDKTSYLLDFVKLPDAQKRIFSNGNFTWTVKGVRRIDSDKDGKLDKIFQEGAESESSFNTNIPTPTKSKAKGAVNPYGL
ncbi:MAG: hypothetical protein J6C25_11160 [Treponema sp.]|nr:hypothetical protein [Treponema sp.]